MHETIRSKTTTEIRQNYNEVHCEKVYYEGRNSLRSIEWSTLRSKCSKGDRKHWNIEKKFLLRNWNIWKVNIFETEDLLKAIRPMI